MSVDATAVYVYTGSPPNLLSGIHKAIDKLNTEVINENNYSP